MYLIFISTLLGRHYNLNFTDTFKQSLNLPEVTEIVSGRDTIQTHSLHMLLRTGQLFPTLACPAIFTCPSPPHVPGPLNAISLVKTYPVLTYTPHFTLGSK